MDALGLGEIKTIRVRQNFNIKKMALSGSRSFIANCLQRAREIGEWNIWRPCDNNIIDID